MIKNIIFDIGNVLMKFDYHPFIKELLKDEDKIEHVNNALWHTGYWNDMDRGEDTDVIFNKMLEAEPDYADEIRLTFDNVGDCIKYCDYAIPWIKELRSRGFKIYYLSNYATHTMDANRQALDFLPYMDGGIFSCYERIIKPDPEIFKLMMKRFSLRPEECVFLDDNPNNVKAAREQGINAVQFADYDQARLELDDLIEINKQ